MSADNWTICPKCKATFEKECELRNADVVAAYGKVEPNEFLALQHDAETANKLPQAETLREDYEIGVGDDGRFYVSYRCSCQNCKFSFKFKKEEQLTV